MQLLDLPNELILDIYRNGGTDLLVDGQSCACRRLRELSNEPDLWEQSLHPLFKQQFMTPHEIARIPDYRAWYLKQKVATRRVIEGVDLLVSEMHDSSPEDLEILVWQVLKLRMRAVEGLEYIRSAPKTLAHFHWAHWLTEVLHRLEGMHGLLDLSTHNNWGNGTVSNPIEQILALYSLRNGWYPHQIFNTLYPRECWESPSQSSDPQVVAEELSSYVKSLSNEITRRSDFLAVLLRCSLFLQIATEQLEWNAQLLKLPIGPYVSVQPPQGEPFFVDFQRGKLRSVADIRDRLQYLRIPTNKIQYGISLYDTLATSYVWHSAPTDTRHCVLDLIEHAANDVQVTPLNKGSQIYPNLVRRIIERNVNEVDNAPLSRAVSSVSLASMNGAPSSSGRLRKGKVVRILASDGQQQQQQQQQPNGNNRVGRDLSGERFGVVLEVSNGSCLVLHGSEQIRVIQAMVQQGYPGKLCSVAGLEMPDIGADMRILGQHFVRYNPQRQAFE